MSYGANTCVRLALFRHIPVLLAVASLLMNQQH